MRYTQEFRDRVVSAALSGRAGQEALAEEFGVGYSTLQTWLRRYRRTGARSMAGKRERRPQEWTREERLEALLATHGLSEEALGSWCRERGIHTHHLVAWRRELVQGEGGGVSKARQRALREENRALRKELRRKDQALAETTALLVLKKKAAAIWGEGEDD